MSQFFASGGQSIGVLAKVLELWCWRRLLTVPWTAGRSNKPILKEISPGRTDVETETPILWPALVKS